MPLELSIDNLSKTYPNGVQALKNVSLAIPAGMFGSGRVAGRKSVAPGFQPGDRGGR